MPEAHPGQSTSPDLDLLRRLWSLSQHGRMPIWVAGQLQGLVLEKLDMSDDVDVDKALGREIVALTAAEVEEIRVREQRIVDGEEQA